MLKWPNFILPLEYDGIGCKLEKKRDNSIGVTLIPDITGIVVEKDTEENNSQIKKYGIISSTGTKITNCVADAVYSTTLSGKTTYYISVQNQEIDVVSSWYQQKDAETQKGSNTEDNSVANETTNTSNSAGDEISLD